MFPFEPASFSVWQLPQPAEAKIAFPSGAAAAPVVVVPPAAAPAGGAEREAVTPQFALPAHFAMYAARSSASFPRARFAGIGCSG